MSEEVKNASTVRSIRASGDVFEKLKEIAAQGKMNNQGEALTALVRLWELDQAKVIIPDRGAEIDNFRVTLQKLEESFINALEINLTAEDRVRQEFTGKLEASAASISALKNAKEDAERDTKHFKSITERLQTEKTQYEIRCERAEKEKRSMKEQCDRALSDKDQLVEAWAKHAADAEAKVKELEDELLAGKDYEKLLNEKTEALKKEQQRSAELQTALDESHRQQAHDIQVRELEFKNQLLEAQKAAQDKIDKMQADFLKRFDALEKKHATEIERLK